MVPSSRAQLATPPHGLLRPANPPRGERGAYEAWCSCALPAPGACWGTHPPARGRGGRGRPPSRVVQPPPTDGDPPTARRTHPVGGGRTGRRWSRRGAAVTGAPVCCQTHLCCARRSINRCASPAPGLRRAGMGGGGGRAGGARRQMGKPCPRLRFSADTPVVCACVVRAWCARGARVGRAHTAHTRTHGTAREHTHTAAGARPVHVRAARCPGVHRGRTSTAGAERGMIDGWARGHGGGGAARARARPAITRDPSLPVAVWVEDGRGQGAHSGTRQPIMVMMSGASPFFAGPARLCPAGTGVAHTGRGPSAAWLPTVWARRTHTR